ncbi:MAG: hypothetical protein MZV64_13370 [Ignavibacteriales bacterium]|nr:hypothetical protein [Ignavibacteriales bacterium]
MRNIYENIHGFDPEIQPVPGPSRRAFPTDWDASPILSVEEQRPGPGPASPGPRG